MRAYQVQRSGEGPVLVDIDRPDPGAGQVRVKVQACGLNFADLLMVKGTYQETPEAPFTLGLEVAGVIDALGDGVDGPAPGTRIAVFGGHGGLADYAVFDAARCVPIPDAMPSDQAAGFLVAYGTSHLALVHRARLQPGERLLVLGAAGGVGLTAVELGAQIGAEVIAVARGADKVAVARDAGAQHVIDSNTEDVLARVKALGGADVIYDAVGGDAFKIGLRAARPEARILTIGFASGTVPQIPANILLVKNVSVLGVYWGGYMAFAPDTLTASLTALMALYDAGKLKPHVGATYPLDKTAEAMELLRSRKSTGKVVVTMD
jgi:NADPH2:quinone reductase